MELLSMIHLPWYGIPFNQVTEVSLNGNRTLFKSLLEALKPELQGMNERAPSMVKVHSTSIGPRTYGLFGLELYFFVKSNHE